MLFAISDDRLMTVLVSIVFLLIVSMIALISIGGTLSLILKELKRGRKRVDKLLWRDDDYW